MKIFSNSSGVIVTGAAGFIGLNLVRFLLAHGHRVLGIDNFSSGSRSQIRSLEGNDLFSFIEGDLCSGDIKVPYPEKYSTVVHLAADVSVQRSVEAPSYVLSHNISSTLNATLLANSIECQNFIFASSCAVYGESSQVNFETSECKPINVYGLSKLLGEDVIKLQSKENCRVSALRFFNVYGPGQKLDGQYGAVIPKWIDLFLSGKPLQIYGSGGQLRDYVSVYDVIEVIHKFVLGEVADEAIDRFAVYNLGTGTSRSLVDLSKIIIEAALATNSTYSNVEYLPPRAGDVMSSMCDNSRLRGALPSIEFRKLELEIPKLISESATRDWS